MNVVWTLLSHYFFQLVNLAIFWHPRRNEWVLCEFKSSYSFILIFLKLSRCFAHGLKMCMWFGQYHHIDYFFFITETTKALILGDAGRAQSFFLIVTMNSSCGRKNV